MKKETKFSIVYYVTILAVLIVLQLLFFSGTGGREEISYKAFRDRLAAGEIEAVVITQEKIIGRMKNPSDTTAAGASPQITEGPTTPWRLRLEKIEREMARQFEVVRLPDEKLVEDLQKAGVEYSGRIESTFLQNFFLNWIFPFILIVAFWGFIFRRMGSTSHHVLSLGKSKAKIYAQDQKNRITFADVAGVDEAVQEVQEVVDFLKNPKKYTALGGKLPKGILLVGPPGTGKTLLARAVAGEAGVPFFSISGSDFVEMFVGVGAARVRDLFEEAKQKAPCIIFIDEIDAIGKSRGRIAVMGGYDERENTLNQLLVEMDGFDSGAGVVIMAATNRPDVLDPALLRPGRFDRQVLVDRPDLSGRVAIFRVHTKNLKLGGDVDLQRLASRTPGFAGAEIANVCNEAALLASRKGKQEIEMRDFEEAIERVIAGLEKKNKVINPRERKVVAYHESGHAIVGHFTPGADPVQKVSIVPRGYGALGYTIQTPLEDRYLMSKSELIGKIKGLLGGRAAEEIVFGEISTGASNDLEKVSQIARAMVTIYGMGKRLPNLSLTMQSQSNFLNEGPHVSRRSEKLEQMIDEEVAEIITQCYAESKELLIEKRELLDRMANLLLEKEVLDQKEIQELLGEKGAAQPQETVMEERGV
ncbi:MAG TPA: ATP-dependent zinc metalloprotease FtsH [Bacteroidota bacterium]|nr:ATP-dependent zinc metalloprotease FtsH [Bacteroidota bacterium]